MKEAGRLFDADTKRQDFIPEHAKFVVSPANSRTVLSAFIKAAKKELLIYDPKVSDRNMLRLLDERRKAGVEIRIIGHASGRRFQARDLSRMRLHTRTIIRDRCDIFLGSQSLRQIELDARREIGTPGARRAAVPRPGPPRPRSRRARRPAACSTISVV